MNWLNAVPPKGWVAFDTETMGLEWYRLDCELLKIEGTSGITKERDKEIRALRKERDKVQGEAADAEKNILAVAQFAYEESVLVLVLDTEGARKLTKLLIEALMAKGCVWLIHNAQFDCRQILHHLKIDMLNAPILDTMLHETLIYGMNPDISAKLSEVGLRYGLPEEIRKTDLESAFSNWFDRLDERAIAYASKDVLSLAPITKAQLPRLKANALYQAAALENKLPAFLARVQGVGLHFDCGKLETFLSQVVPVKTRLENRARGVLGDINLHSSPQVLEALRRHYGYVPVQKKFDPKLKGFVEKESVDKDALLESGLLDEPAIQAYVGVKELQGRIKLAKTWLDTGGRQPVSIFQLPTRGVDGSSGGARTGRTSASPRLQNIPNFMKQFVTAPEGWLILSSDYAAIQLRIIASLSGDKAMLEAFNNGVSLHKKTCEWAFKIPYADVDKKAPYYTVAKEINFGLPFGMGARKLKWSVFMGTDGKLPITEEEAQGFYDAYFKAHPQVKDWQESVYGEACKSGKVSTASGRYRLYREQDRPDLEKSRQYKAITIDKEVFTPYGGDMSMYTACYRAADWRWRNVAYNTPVQGTEADGVKAALRLYGERQDQERLRLFATVHDSLDSFVREDSIDYGLKLQHDAMIEGMSRFVPNVAIEVEHTVGKYWATLPNNYQDLDYGLWIVDNVKDFQRDCTIR